METHNKILLAGELLVDAAKNYRSGVENIDFAKSILLAGAVIGIVAPCLEDIGVKSTHRRLAELSAQLKGIDLNPLPPQQRKKEIGKSIAFYRLSYNSLKHAGKGSEIKASDDLLFKANLKEEAYDLINAAIDDYNKLTLSQRTINNELSDDLLTLLQSHWAP